MVPKQSNNNPYFIYERLKSREVHIGNLVLGGDHPIVIQSMTNTNSLDTKETVEQAIRILKAGGELIRITAQGVSEAKNLKNIKAELVAKGYNTPLSADIHFNPKLAEIAAQYIDKVRINPGNYAEENTKAEYSDIEYKKAINRITEKLKPLISICKKHQTAIRIGVNHGSLSNRILSRYGNTVLGMVESALEFVKIFEEAQFYDLIISLKSSHVLTMVHANRLLASRMLKNKKIYPIHLGVTEAGNGLEGRQKSIAGIATLLNEGIGDTIRVSLTEAPENEIPMAISLRDNIRNRKGNKSSKSNQKVWFDPYSYTKRDSKTIRNIGGKNLPIVIGAATQTYSRKVQGQFKGEKPPAYDYLYIGKETPLFLPDDNLYIQDYSVWKNEYSNCFPLLNAIDLQTNKIQPEQIAFVRLTDEELESQNIQETLKKIPLAVLVLTAISENPISEWREAFYVLHKEQINIPVILYRKFDLDQMETLLLAATKDYSALLIDGFGDGIWLEDNGAIPLFNIRQISFGILQSCRLRLTQTDYIVCPSCGRTLFNIEERLEEIRAKTKHLKHLKIAVMGCVVNGLGEMADADYGYVGSGIGKVNLYKGKELKQKNLPEKTASDSLIALIKTEGDWKNL